MFGLSDKQAVGDLEAAADYLRGLAGATGKVGAIGFCSGGRHTLLFACSSKKVDAAIDCWGGFIHRATPNDETTASRPRALLDMVKNMHCPVFGVFGEEDQNPPVALEAELKKRAAAAGKDVTTKIYKGAGHAFLADYRPSYREGPAHELWNDATGVFQEASGVANLTRFLTPDPLPAMRGEGVGASPLSPSPHCGRGGTRREATGGEGD